jgi:L-threonylcarbamoyladenylate synthase
LTVIAADEARPALEACIRTGGVAVFPADGLYGLACDPSNADAVARIHELKGRDEGKPSAVMFFAPLELREVLSMSGPRTREAIGALLPGPVTLVIDNSRKLYPLACREDPERLGIRLIEGPLEGARVAIFQTSANRSGDEPAASFDRLDERIAAGADLLIDGGELGGRPSTVVDLTRYEEGEWSVLREGVLTRKAVGRALRAGETRG